jgi:disease resistance protein RPS2
MAKKC